MQKEIKQYEVTGILYNGKRFKLVYSAGKYAFFTAMNIGLWNGSVWVRYPDGTRKRIKRVIN